MMRALGTLIIAAAGATAAADNIRITVENLNAPGGFSLTPFWLAVHDGSFDIFDPNTMSSNWPGLTELAEEGDTSVLGARFESSMAFANGGVHTTLVQPNGAPVFSPGESASITLDVGDASVNRWLGFATMVVPSNDLFIASGNPTRFELFDAGGNFNGPIVIDILGQQVKDNGTEVNDAFDGAAFSTNGGSGTDESFNIRNFFTQTGDEAYLASFIGTGTADGGSITNAFGRDDLIARITIVPAPAAGSLALLGLAAVRRRR